MGRRIVVAAAMAAGLAGCTGYTVRSFEETQAQFTAHRPALEVLAAKIHLCGEFHTEIDRPCAGPIHREEILADMKSLGLIGATSNRDGTRVELINGDDGHGPTPMSRLGVMSGMVHHATPQPAGGDLETPLTPPPHYWFYTQHD